MPSGHASVIALAWVTPLWRRMMHSRVVAHYDGGVRHANLHHRRASRYGAHLAGGAREAAAVGP
jgi:alkane 1-monooxygenase